MNSYINKYQQAEVKTASQEQILLLLYDGAIRFLNKAKQGIQDGDIQTSHNNLMKAQKIILEFMNTLDMEVGGEVAKNLYSLYEFMYDHLVQANVKKDVAKIDIVLEHLKELRMTWAEAIKIAAKEAAAEEGASQEEKITLQEKNSEEIQRLGIVNA